MRRRSGNVRDERCDRIGAAWWRPRKRSGSDEGKRDDRRDERPAQDESVHGSPLFVWVQSYYGELRQTDSVRVHTGRRVDHGEEV